METCDRCIRHHQERGRPCSCGCGRFKCMIGILDIYINEYGIARVNVHRAGEWYANMPHEFVCQRAQDLLNFVGLHHLPEGWDQRFKKLMKIAKTEG